MKHKIFVNDKVHVRKTRCDTCIFGPHSPVSVERREGMVTQCGEEGAIPCHHHLYNNEKINPVCKGFFDRYNTIMQLADRLGYIEWT